jgi:hypothetical protein
VILASQRACCQELSDPKGAIGHATPRSIEVTPGAFAINASSIPSIQVLELWTLRDGRWQESYKVSGVAVETGESLWEQMCQDINVAERYLVLRCLANSGSPINRDAWQKQVPQGGPLKVRAIWRKSVLEARISRTISFAQHVRVLWAKRPHDQPVPCGIGR